jgi:hypothetical protein
VPPCPSIVPAGLEILVLAVVLVILLIILLVVVLIAVLAVSAVLAVVRIAGAVVEFVIIVVLIIVGHSISLLIIFSYRSSMSENRKNYPLYARIFFQKI